MIHVLYGENEFQKRQVLQALIKEADVVRYDGEVLSLDELQDIFIGQTLFGDSITHIIVGLSGNGDIWPVLSTIVCDEQKTIILIENAIDKRTKTYKWLQKTAKMQEFVPFNERQKPQLIKWCVAEAGQLGFRLQSVQAERLIDRLGYDQLRLFHVLEQLSLADKVTDGLIDEMVPLAKTESAFGLLAATLDGDVLAIQRIIAHLEKDGGADGAYQTMGLLASQTANLAALVLSGNDRQLVAADLAVNPYVLQKISPYVAKIDRQNLEYITSVLGRVDSQMKAVNVNPWLLMEAALVDIASHQNMR